jgi:hypothetical protein
MIGFNAVSYNEYRVNTQSQAVEGKTWFVDFSLKVRTQGKNNQRKDKVAHSSNVLRSVQCACPASK